MCYCLKEVIKISSKESTLIALITIIVLFNFIYAIANPEITGVVTINDLRGLVTGTLFTLVLGVITLATTKGLGGESIKLLFGIGGFMNILFQINIGGFPIGLGLGMNLLNAFPMNIMGGIPYFFAWGIIIMTFILMVYTLIGG